jgi:hypothetical protein
MTASKSGKTVKGEIDVWWENENTIKVVVRREPGPSQPGSPTSVSRSSNKGLFERLKVLLDEGGAPRQKLD